MTEVNWNRPIVTNAGKPARVTREHDCARRIEGDFGDGLDYWWVTQDGVIYGSGKSPPVVRNATPAEILAHPDIWPEWQDGAREMQLREDFEVAEGDGTVRKKAAYVAEAVQRTAAQPDGVFVTREILGQALARVGSANYHYLDAIADALGIPPDAPKVAPWEVAYEAWRDGQSGFFCRPLDAYAAGVMFAVGQIEAAMNERPAKESKAVQALAQVRAAIMGGKHD